MYGNPTFDCDGAEIRAHCRQLATVATVKGMGMFMRRPQQG